jgi:hypothetical protein
MVKIKEKQKQSLPVISQFAKFRFHQIVTRRKITNLFEMVHGHRYVFDKFVVFNQKQVTNFVELQTIATCDAQIFDCTKNTSEGEQ